MIQLCHYNDRKVIYTMRISLTDSQIKAIDNAIITMMGRVGTTYDEMAALKTIANKINKGNVINLNKSEAKIIRKAMSSELTSAKSIVENYDAVIKLLDNRC